MAYSIEPSLYFYPRFLLRTGCHQSTLIGTTMWSHVLSSLGFRSNWLWTKPYTRKGYKSRNEIKILWLQMHAFPSYGRCENWMKPQDWHTSDKQYRECTRLPTETPHQTEFIKHSKCHEAAEPCFLEAYITKGSAPPHAVNHSSIYRRLGKKQFA